MTEHTWAQVRMTLSKLFFGIFLIWITMKLGVDTGLVTGVDAELWILMAVAHLAETLGFDPVLLGELLCLVLSAITWPLRRTLPHTYNLT